jgi:hypothetical protein
MNNLKRKIDKMENNPPRVGIFVCECGGNIGDVVDVKAVKLGKELLSPNITNTFVPDPPKT